MSHIFISYSKIDIEFARHLRALLTDQGFAVWMDETRLVSSEQWWPTIEKNIVGCAAFIVIMSPNSLASEWVEREILVAENKKHRRSIFPVLIDGDPFSRLGNLQYEPMQDGAPIALRDEFVEALSRHLLPGKGVTPPPLPGATIAPSQPIEAPAPVPLPTRRARLSPVLLIAGIALAVVVALLIGLLLLPGDGAPTPTPPTIPTQTGTALALVVPPTATDMPASADPPTPSATDTFVPPTPTPVPPTPTATLNATQDEATLRAVMAGLVVEQATIAAAAVAATAAMLTATADAWTDTPTPDVRATAAARLTATQNQLDRTATAAAWTDTPTPSSTPIPLGEVGNPVTSNAQWTAREQDFGGVAMVRVPAGCFTIG
ncbi:MAG: toll/interleukin-1 receptor domain-containing protein, partial [Chloroflexota bacterium]|nr:toll/interleukin-1 receptor domain-containing protein [Chloroflexota bacterium]